ncbi:hypothetical protein ABPG74_015060 [Tetrahymena malaccensis]
MKNKEENYIYFCFQNMDQKLILDAKLIAKIINFKTQGKSVIKVNGQNHCPDIYEYHSNQIELMNKCITLSQIIGIQSENQMSPQNIVMIPNTNILIIKVSDQSQLRSLFYYIDKETQKVLNAVEINFAIYQIMYIPSLNSIVGLNYNSLYLLDIYSLNINQQITIVQQISMGDSFNDNSVVVLYSLQNVIVAYDLQLQNVINTYQTNQSITYLKCLTFPNKRHVVLIKYAYSSQLWDTENGSIYDANLPQIESWLTYVVVQYQSSYYVLISQNLNVILMDMTNYQVNNIQMIYQLSIPQSDPNISQIITNLAISQQDNLSHNYLLVCYTSFNFNLYQIPKLVDPQNFQLSLIKQMFSPYINTFMMNNDSNLYLLIKDYIQIYNFKSENNPQSSLLLYYSVTQKLPRLCLSLNYQDIYVSILQSDNSYFLETSNQSGGFKIYYNYQSGIYLDQTSTQIIKNSNYTKVAYKLSNGQLMIFSTDTLQVLFSTLTAQQIIKYFYFQFSYFSVLGVLNWIGSQSYTIIQYPDHYLYVSINIYTTPTSIIAVNLNTQAFLSYFAPDGSALLFSHIYDLNDQKVYSASVIGKMYVWDFNTTFIYQHQLSQCSIQNMIKISISKMIVFQHCNNIISQFSEEDYSIKQILQVVPLITVLKYIEQIDLIAVGVQLQGKVYIFKFNSQTKMYEQLLMVKTQYQQTIQDISFTPISKQLFIYADYSNLFFDISKCLQNVEMCLSCSFEFYFLNSQSPYVQNNSFGQGTLDYPFTSYQSIAYSFLVNQRYQRFIQSTKSIKTTIYTNYKYPLNLFEYFFNLFILNILQLSFKSYSLDANQSPATIKLLGNFTFNNFSFISIENIILQFNTTQNPKCSITFNSILNQVQLINLQIQNVNQQQQDCNTIQLVGTDLILQNTTLDSNSFSRNKHFIISNGSKNNLNLTNSNIGDLVLFTQSSHTYLQINGLNIINNYCSMQTILKQQYTTSLFHAGEISMTNVNITGNSFCNANLFQIEAQEQCQNLTFYMNQIVMVDNSFTTISQNLFFSSLFSSLPSPDHQIIAKNFVVKNNSIAQSNQQYQDQYFFTNLLTTNNIQNITIQDINFIDNHYFSFINCEQSYQFQVIIFNCSYSQSYTNQYQNKPSSSCLSIQETQNISISNLTINQKIAYDSNLIDIQNLKTNQAIVNIENSTFQNILLIQSKEYKQANPIFIIASYKNTYFIQNCLFKNNQLLGIPNSIVTSTTALQISNTVGDLIINKSQFISLFSNSDSNALYLVAQNIQVNNCLFDTMLYSSQLNIPPNQILDKNSLKGSSIFAKSKQIQIQQSIFQVSQSHIGGFIYISSFADNLNVNIIQSIFKDSLTKLNGGAIFFDFYGTNLLLSIQDSSFENIYQFKTQSSLIYINQDDIGKQNLMKTKIELNNVVNFTNIFGQDISYLLSVGFTQLDVKRSYYTTNSSLIPSTLLPINIFISQNPSTFIFAQYSNINMNGLIIKDISDSYSDSYDHQMFIKSQESDFQIIDCQIFQLKMNVGGVAYFFQSSIVIQNLQSHNVQFQNPPKSIRMLQQYPTNVQKTSFFNFIESKVQILSSNSSWIQCQQNCQGGFGLLQSSQLTLLESNFTNLSSKEGGVLQIINPTSETKVIGCLFQDNFSGLNGGAFSVSQNQMGVYNFSFLGNTFYRNIADKGKGGAIYFTTQQATQNDQLTINRNIIINNQAKIGGGIKYDGIIPILQNNQIYNNSAYLYGQNIFSYPTKLLLEQIKDSNNNLTNIQYQENKVIIVKHRSGALLPDLTFSLRNDQMDLMKFDNPDQIQTTYLKLQVDLETKNFPQYYLRGDIKANYNVTNNFFQFNSIYLIGKPLTNVTLLITSDQILVGSIRGKFWNSRYSKVGKYSCVKCDEISQNYLVISFIILWTLMSMFVSIKSNDYQIAKKCYLSFFLKLKRQYGDLIVMQQKAYKQEKNPVSVYIKIFTTYFQIISCISTFNLDVPIEQKFKDYYQEKSTSKADSTKERQLGAKRILSLVSCEQNQDNIILYSSPNTGRDIETLKQISTDRNQYTIEENYHIDMEEKQQNI